MHRLLAWSGLLLRSILRILSAPAAAELPSPGPLLQSKLGYVVHCMFPTIGTLDKGRFKTSGYM